MAAVEGPLAQAVTVAAETTPTSAEMLPSGESERHTDAAAIISPASPASPAKFEIVPPKRSASAEEFQSFPEVDADTEPIEPAYYYEGGGIPVFTPTMDQFKSFKRFVEKINHYGMKAGIIKIIPPKEWRDALPPLDEKVKEIKVKNPIEQHIAGLSGEYRQTNLEKQRTYNLAEWRALCEASNRQPPAKRGERRRGQEPEKPRRSTRKQPVRRSARNRDPEEDDLDSDDGESKPRNPPTPKSPEKPQPEAGTPEPVRDAHGRQPRHVTIVDDDATPDPVTDSHGRQPRRGRQPRQFKTLRQREADREAADAKSFEDFDYRISNADEYTPERCEELEKAYWKTLSYNNPLYGADMPGSLFDSSTTTWNVADLKDGILDWLGKKLPGVNTAYLYLGMWKATFSWHLEDMDLYSINYIHFGAPKQWYSISRSDKAKFEQVMKNIWPNDARKCPQYLRHKTYLVSPAMLAQHGIKVNRLVHHEGEFVITFPFGYHSGYNLGYNCAESVNFATHSWLEYGRQAKKCECIDDAVYVDVEQIERRMRGEPTDDEDSDDSDEPDYYYDDSDDEEGHRAADLPTPPESVEGKVKTNASRKRKADGADKSLKKRSKNAFHKTPAREPCILCPNDIPSEALVQCEDGKEAHRLCAIYTPEAYFKWDPVRQIEVVAGIADIPKARLDLKCGYCKQKKGSCFQCCLKRCTKAYHATCAAVAGVCVNIVDTTFTGEDGIAHAATAIDYRCKLHRPKRSKNVEAEHLEEDPIILAYGKALKDGDTVQYQFIKEHIGAAKVEYTNSDVFAGVVIENRPSEHMVLLEKLPHGGQQEVEWKYMLVQDPRKTDFPDAVITGPLQADKDHPGVHGIRKIVEPPQPGIPQRGEPFGDPQYGHVWEELELFKPNQLPEQAPATEKGWWYYLGELSTEYISKFTENPRKRVPNDAAHPQVQRKARAKPTPRPSMSMAVPHIHYHPQQQQYSTPAPNGNGTYYYTQPMYAHPQAYHNQRVPPPPQYAPPQQIWPAQYRPQNYIKQEPGAQYAPQANMHTPPAPMASMAPVAPMAPMASAPVAIDPVLAAAPHPTMPAYRRPSQQQQQNGSSPQYHHPSYSHPQHHHHQQPQHHSQSHAHPPHPAMAHRSPSTPIQPHPQHQHRQSFSGTPITPQSHGHFSVTPPQPSPLTPQPPAGANGRAFFAASPSPQVNGGGSESARAETQTGAPWAAIQSKLAELAREKYAAGVPPAPVAAMAPPQQQQQT